MAWRCRGYATTISNQGLSISITARESPGQAAEATFETPLGEIQPFPMTSKPDGLVPVLIIEFNDFGQ
jgi:hypothetical protein